MGSGGDEAEALQSRVNTRRKFFGQWTDDSIPFTADEIREARAWYPALYSGLACRSRVCRCADEGSASNVGRDGHQRGGVSCTDSRRPVPGAAQFSPLRMRSGRFIGVTRGLG